MGGPEEMMDELLDVEERLSQWEYDFLCDVSCQEFEITEAQEEKIEEIYTQRIKEWKRR